MKIIQWLIVIIGIILIVVHGFWSDVFKVDGITIVILFILSIPFVAQYLRKAKFPGAEFEFKEEIRETQKLVQLSVEQAEKDERAGEAKILPFETFKLSAVKELLDSDSVLALAALQIEIEKKLRTAADFLDLPMRDRLSISKLIGAVSRKELLSFEQITALRKIINMCNKAIHGSLISREEAREIIDLAEELNKTFSIGYSIDFSPNPDYARHGLICEWEHCIEWMPLTEEPTEYSCPVFGHNCPGGVERISKCSKTIEDIPIDRFMKK
jgi:hypothetical protein